MQSVIKVKLWSPFRNFFKAFFPYLLKVLTMNILLRKTSDNLRIPSLYNTLCRWNSIISFMITLCIAFITWNKHLIMQRNHQLSLSIAIVHNNIIMSLLWIQSNTRKNISLSKFCWSCYIVDCVRSNYNWWGGDSYSFNDSFFQC